MPQKLFLNLLLTGCFLALCLPLLQAQKANKQGVLVQFVPVYDGEALKPDHAYGEGSAAVQIDVLRFYISRVGLMRKGKNVFKEKNSVHLLDLADPLSLQFCLPVKGKKGFDRLQFSLGIDSTTNVSGALDGDLDPTKGMYWTWQSGYINFKCEGQSEQCPTRNHAFQYHLGGYRHPFGCIQQVDLALKAGQTITVYVDVKRFLDELNLSEEHTVMSPGEEAKRLSELAARAFYAHE